MFRIGEFSRIAQTAVSQLRYYDQIGLFQPKYTDPITGYRYYSAAQLPALNRILAMKELGLSLEQIKRLIGDNVSAEELRGMLALKKAQVEQDIHTEIKRLHRIEVRLRQVEQAGEMSSDDVVLKEIPAQPFISFRDTLTDIRQARIFVMEMSRLLPSRVSKKKIDHLTFIFHSEAFVIENADIEMGFLVNDVVNEPLPLSSGQQLTMRILPRIEMAACVVRVGGPEKSVESYEQLGHWIENNGYQMAGPVREVFIVPPNPERVEETVCEVQIPVSQNLRKSLPVEQ